MKILVTGHKGFIGTHLVKKLEKLGHKVFGMDKVISGAEDINYLPSCRAIIKKAKPDIVIHLAALVGVRKSLEEPKEYFETNVFGTNNILTACEELGIKKVLVASSSSVYGNQESPLTEDMICDKQASPYAISKKGTEMVCSYFSNKLPIIVFRPFTVYGENGRPDMVIAKLINAGKNDTEFTKYGNGESARGYTHVDDLTDGIVKLLGYTPENNFEIFNLGGSEVIKLNDLINIIKEQYPNLKVKEVPMPEVDIKYSYAGIDKAFQQVGWKPKKIFNKEIIKLCQNNSK